MSRRDLNGQFARLPRCWEPSRSRWGRYTPEGSLRPRSPIRAGLCAGARSRPRENSRVRWSGSTAFFRPCLCHCRVRQSGHHWHQHRGSACGCTRDGGALVLLVPLVESAQVLTAFVTRGVTGSGNGPRQCVRRATRWEFETDRRYREEAGPEGGWIEGKTSTPVGNSNGTHVGL
jgi:hypothetical protein